MLLQSIRRTKSRDAENMVHYTTAADIRAVKRIAANPTADPRVVSATRQTGDGITSGETNGGE